MFLLSFVVLWLPVLLYHSGMEINNLGVEAKMSTFFLDSCK